jgi:hypothetical protein
VILCVQSRHAGYGRVGIRRLRGRRGRCR